MYRPILAATVLMLATFGGAQAEGIQGNARHGERPPVLRMPIGASTLAPFAYVQFCVANASDCDRSAGARSLEWSDETRAAVNAVNLRVNRSIRPRGDRGEVWSVDVSVGDCEDYALTKRRALLKAGFAPGALRLATATTREGEWHTVLVVVTDRGDMVLDNRVGDIRSWNRTGLRWSKIASAENPQIWNSVHGGPVMREDATAAGRYQVRSKE